MFLYKRFVGGVSAEEVIKTAARLYEQRNWHPIIDYAQESSITKQDALKCQTTLESCISLFNETSATDMQKVAFAMKLSSFAPHRPGKTLQKLVRQVLENPSHSVLLDAEQDSLHALEKFHFKALLLDNASPRLYKTYQMYRRDALGSMINDLDHHSKLGIKLVRGAYMNQDLSVVHPTIEDTHRVYNNALRHVLENVIPKRKQAVRLMIATHNQESVELAISILKQGGHEMSKQVAFAQLMGMADHLSDRIVTNGFTVYKYIPFGRFWETFPYLTRRLHENMTIVKHMSP